MCYIQYKLVFIRSPFFLNAALAASCHIFVASFSFIDIHVCSRGVCAASYCTKFKQMHSVFFFSRVVLLSEGSWTHTRFCSSSAYSIRPFYWVMGIPQVSQWNCFPPYSPVSLKIASPTDTECVGKLFINFNIRVTVTGFIRYISIICGIAFFIQGELNRWIILCRYCCPLFRTLHVRQTWQDWFLNIEHFLSFGVNAL